MLGKRFAVSLTAAAALGAFGPAFAESSSTTVDSNVGVNANGGVRSSDVDAGANVDGQGSAATSADKDNGSPMSGATSDEDSSKHGRGHAYGHDKEDKATGLDRADQAAGEHGEQGRDNARMHQSGKY